MIKVVSFRSMDEALDHMRKDREVADASVDQFLEVKIGDFFVRVASDFLIYGEILDPSKPAEPGTYSADELEEYAEDGKLYAQPHMKHYRFTRCFSPLCVDGELGDVHVSTIAQLLTKEQFELAQKNGWPQTPAELRTLLKLQAPGSA